MGNTPATDFSVAMQAEMLDAATELRLAYAWRDERDEAALHRLITAHVRLAISTATKFKRYGFPMDDLIQEASLGLMKSANKFDPDRGFRFATYAVWWIKAALREYVMRNWSMVRLGTSSSQKSLFFNQRRAQNQIERAAAASGEQLVSYQMLERIAVIVGVPLHDVEMMGGRLSGSDTSLNATQSSEGEGNEWIDSLEDDGPQAAELVERSRDGEFLHNCFDSVLAELSPRDQFIIRERRLIENPRTLESLGTELGISKERVRQLEARAFKKMRQALTNRHPEARLLLA